MSWIGIANSGEILFSTSENDLVSFGELRGDVSGILTNASVVGIAGFPIVGGTPGTDQILKFDGSQWTYAPDASGTGATPHDLLGPTHSDTTAAVPLRGSLIYGSGASPTWNRLELGSAEFVPYSDGTDIAYTRLGQNTPFENGTAGSPGVTFDGDHFSGMFLVSSGVVAVSAGTDELLRLDGGNTQVTIDAGQVVQTRAGGTTTLTTADYMYMVTSVPSTATLPAAPTEGQVFYVKDRDGLAGNPVAQRITISGNGSNIDGNASIQIRNSYGSFTLIFSGSEWNVI